MRDCRTGTMRRPSLGSTSAGIGRDWAADFCMALRLPAAFSGSGSGSESLASEAASEVRSCSALGGGVLGGVVGGVGGREWVIFFWLGFGG